MANTVKLCALYHLLLFTLYFHPINSEETYESSKDICKRCSCTNGTAEDLVLECVNQGINHALSNWPKHDKKLRATFADNNITTLEKLPSTDAHLEVVFSNCSIKYLDAGVFVGVKNIRYVDFSYNLLTAEEISSEKFKGPFNNDQFEPIALEHLNLAYNLIHSLGRNVFEHLPNLKVLNLEGNHFRVLDLQTQLALSSVLNLENLNLANNQLTELVDDAIIKYKNLSTLNLSKNELDFVPTCLAQVGHSLKTLILDDNPIVEIAEETFLGLSNIVNLSANNLTDLKYVNANAFVPLTHLKVLHLSNNVLLWDISREAFGINQTIDELYLNNNRLSRIDYKLVPQWSALKIFEFRDNPLDCNCDLYNITTSLRKDIVRDEDGPYCYDIRFGRSVSVFYLKSDVCSAKAYQIPGARFVTHRFTVLRITLVILSVVLMLAAFVALTLGYTRFRKFNRNRNYPFASQVLYNPLSTGRF